MHSRQMQHALSWSMDYSKQNLHNRRLTFSASSSSTSTIKSKDTNDLQNSAANVFTLDSDSRSSRKCILLKDCRPMSGSFDLDEAWQSDSYSILSCSDDKNISHDIPVLEASVEEQDDDIHLSSACDDRKRPITFSSDTSIRMSVSSLAIDCPPSKAQVRRSSTGSIERHVIRSGWLYKQRGDVFKSWVRRYFVLIQRTHVPTGRKSASLQYYKSAQCGEIRGEMHFQDAKYPSLEASASYDDDSSLLRHTNKLDTCACPSIGCQCPVSIRFVEKFESKRPFCFEIRRGNMQLLCQARTDEDVSAWVCELQDKANIRSAWSDVDSSLLPNMAQNARYSASMIIQSFRPSKVASHTGNTERHLRGSNLIRTHDPRNSLSKPDVFGQSKFGTSGETLFFKKPGRLRSDSIDLPSLLLSSKSKNPTHHSREIEICIATELRKLLHDSNGCEAGSCKSFIRSFSFKAAHTLPPLAQLRAFHSNMSEGILRDHGQRILKSLVQRVNQLKLHVGEDKLMFFVRVCTCRHLEEYILRPIWDKLDEYLTERYREQNTRIYRHVKWLQGKDQTFFAIPYRHHSPSEWRCASRTFSKVTSSMFPTAKYDVFINTIHEIQATYAKEHKDDDVDMVLLDVSDIIPIFTHVIANSGVENLMSLLVIFSQFHASWTIGKKPRADNSNIVVDILNSAIQFIQNVQIPSVMTSLFTDPVTCSIDKDWRSFMELRSHEASQNGACIYRVTKQGRAAFGSRIRPGHVLVTVNGQSVVLWSFADTVKYMNCSSPPFRFAFISSQTYTQSLQMNIDLWNVALMNACQRNDLASVQMILANGACVNFVSPDTGNTPLHVAVGACCPGIVSYLLQHGARANTLGEYGRNALHMVGAPCSMPCPAWKRLFKKSYSQKCPPSAHDNNALLPDISIVRKLLQYGISCEQTDVFGNTVLMLLAARGSLGVIDLIMDLCPSLDIQARNWTDGMTALVIGAQTNRYEIVEALLDYGADARIRTLRGETALHFASAAANQSMCQLLVEHGCPVDALTERGLTPLMIAVSGKHSKTLLGRFDERMQRPLQVSLCEMTDEQECRESAQSNAKDREQHPSMGCVAATVHYLLSIDSDQARVCQDFRTVLHYAALYADQDLYLLVEKSIQAKQKDKMSDSARDPSDCFDIFGNTPRSLIAKSESSVTCFPTPCLAAVAAKSIDAEHTFQDQVPHMVEMYFRHLLQCMHVHWEDVKAFVRHVISSHPYWSLLNAIRAICPSPETLQIEKESEQTNATLTLRTIANILTQLVDNLQVDASDFQYIEELYRITSSVLSSVQLYDTQCFQWIHSFSSIPRFVLAFQSHGMAHFLSRSPDEVYQSLHMLLRHLEAESPGTKFLKRAVNESHTSESFPARGMRLSNLETVSPQTLDTRISATSSINTLASSASSNYAVYRMEHMDHVESAVADEGIRRKLMIAGVSSADDAEIYICDKSTQDPAKKQQNDALTSLPKLSTLFQQAANLAPSLMYPKKLWRSHSLPSVQTRCSDAAAITFAQQITLLQHHFFCRINISEIISPTRDAIKTPCYNQSRELHHHISMWVLSTLLAQSDVDQRAQLLDWFIQIAKQCLAPLQNYDGFIAIMNAINDTSIYRLKRTWDRLPSSSRELWHCLNKNTEKAARNIMKAMQECTPPSVPYMGVVLQQWVALDECPIFCAQTQGFNLNKIRHQDVILETIARCQKMPYMIPIKPHVLRELCSEVAIRDKEVAFERSLLTEPRV